jgi:hypothetical protein
MNIGDVIIISDFAPLLPTTTMMAILFCIATVMTAFAAGWWFRGRMTPRRSGPR